jgi:hypothetical protein
VIRNRLNPQLRDQFIQKAEHYRETHPRISSSERARLIVGLRTTIAEHKAHEPRDPTEKDAHHAAYDAVLAEVDAILGDNNPTSFEAFTDRHGSSIGLGLYHAGDAALQMVAENERADAFSAKTPHEVWEGTAPPNTRLSYGIEAARHGINATYGLIPLVSWQGYNDASKHSLASKIMGAGHLIARVSNVLHKWTRGESPLSGKTAHSLSYYNRRFGPTSAAKDLNAASRKLGRMRLALRLLGQGLIPGMSAYHYDKHKHLGNYTSPGLASANVTGLIDSIMDICWRIYRMRKIAEIKASASKMEHTLSTAPPTQSEKARDQYVAGVLRDDEF